MHLTQTNTLVSLIAIFVRTLIQSITLPVAGIPVNFGIFWQISLTLLLDIYLGASPRNRYPQTPATAGSIS